MDLMDLTLEQLDRVRTCKTPEELVALAMECGIELSGKELDEVAGGGIGWFESLEDSRLRFSPAPQ